MSRDNERIGRILVDMLTDMQEALDSTIRSIDSTVLQAQGHLVYSALSEPERQLYITLANRAIYFKRESKKHARDAKSPITLVVTVGFGTAYNASASFLAFRQQQKGDRAIRKLLDELKAKYRCTKIAFDSFPSWGAWE